MFTGDYGFFDYKYDIAGYHGQDFGGPAQFFYLAISAVLLVLLLRALRAWIGSGFGALWAGPACL
ncbi:MAG: hypothetical protein IKS05_00430 [Oscillospiraceae bacterium]|nr:hypothetical protein [Oscillospiraceae bacterium]